VPAHLRCRCNRSEGRAWSILDDLVSLVPVKVPLKESIASLVQLGALLASRDGSTVVATLDVNVESLRPELPLGDIAVVVDGHNLSAEDVVAAGDLARDGDALSIVVIVEDGVSAPVSSLALRSTIRVATLSVVDQGALMDLEELELGLVNLAAVTVARGKVGGSPAVVAAVPTVLTAAATTLVVPVESDLGSSLDVSRVRRRGGILVGLDRSVYLDTESSTTIHTMMSG
jgi:hypothetical protein